MRNPRATQILLFATLLLLPASGLTLEVGDRAPAFAAESLDGSRQLSLRAYRGKVVYLDFWASWCPPCLQSLPLLESLRKEFLADEVQFLAVNLDRDLDQARAFLREHSIGYPSATDPEGRLPESFQIKKMPTSFVIDRDGVIRYVHAGFRPSDIGEIRAQIRRLVGGKR